LVFREISTPDLLVFVSTFADAEGNVISNPWSAEWPLETLSKVTFVQHAWIGGGTVVTVEWLPINASAIERATFEAGRTSMNQGWGGTMEQLAQHLSWIKNPEV